jgi:ADP-ribosyl-[dinitrogen reductase] hydrolase
MYGAILGDLIGAPWEFKRMKRKDFTPIIRPDTGITDDSIMTVAIADSLLHEIPPAEAMRDWSRRVMPAENVAGYGASFIKWLASPEIQPPYNSYGNGAAMRVSPAGWLYDDLEVTLEVARLVTDVTHNHPEGIKGAQATAMAIFLARQDEANQNIRESIQERFKYDLDRSVDQCREEHIYNEFCQICVPDSIICALDSESYEDAVRNAVSLGGDADTLAAIAGSIAEVIHGIPVELIAKAQPYLDESFIPIIEEFYERIR